MIQKLRHKFVLTNMALVSVVLVAVFAVQCFTTYQMARDNVDQALNEAVIQTRERFLVSVAPGFESKEKPPGEPGEARLRFTIPHFGVELDSEGQVTGVRAGPGVEVDEETAQSLVNAALAQDGDRGSLAREHLDFLVRAENGALYIGFADNSSVSQSLQRQILTSLLICAAALLAFWLISRFLARRSLRPVEEAWDKQRQFVADASHELKTPITVILANTDIVLSHPDSTVQEESKWIEYTREEAGRMKSLVNDLLFLAKSDAAQAPLHPLPVLFSDLVDGSVMSFESVAFEAGVHLEELVDPGLLVSGDEGQLRRLTVILLDNAVKYAGKGGTVTVKLENQGDGCRLTVHNTGPAIAPEHLPRLFERFYRADAARDRAQGGYGLGLAIAKTIVDAHGGKISVTSTERDGTAFTVVLPQSKKG